MTSRPRDPKQCRGRRRLPAFIAVLVVLCTAGCDRPASKEGSAPAEGTSAAARPAAATSGAFTPPQLDAADAAFLDDVQERTFRFFWEESDPKTGLTPDRHPTKSFISVSATGFALTAYPIGVEHGWVTREAAAERVVATLRYFRDGVQDTSVAGAMGWKGFFYHFLEPSSGHRFRDVELSTVDTALFFAGALFCQSYFDRPDPTESEIRALAEELVSRADWRWASPRAPAIGHGWTPEGGQLEWDWRGYNEAMLIPILALASSTYPVGDDAWEEWCKTYTWGTFHGQEHIGFPPLFGHQYSHVWIDFRGIQDAVTREKGIDYFENSRRATIAQRAYAIENLDGWAGYGENSWGLSACDGPVEGTFEIAGRPRTFRTYSARGASYVGVQDDGTLCPAAMGASLPFAPEIVLPALRAMRESGGDFWYGEYGFFDAVNPTLTIDIKVQHGRIDPARGWVDTDYLGIDQGPLVAMIENYRTDLVWRTMRGNAHIVRGLRRAGFSGGWLDRAEPVK